jgi:hypothetical protein
MGSSSDWIDKAFQELDALERSMEADPEDAWRAAVLIARLRGAPDGPKPSEVIMARLPELLRVAGPPDCGALLDAFADELESFEDPWGPLLDVLLDVDDTLGVLGLSDGDQEALELATHVAALSSLYPERLMALTAFAQMRLETVSDASPLARVWRAVERAPAQLLADALPIPARPGAQELSRLASKYPWLDALYSKLQRVLDETTAAVATQLSAFIQPAEAQLDLAASLSASGDRPKAIELVWGKFPCVELAVDELVELEVPPTCQLWYALAGGSSSFPEASWVLVHNESPVLIIATESSHAQTLEEALASGGRAAGLILVESFDVSDK